MQKDHRHFFNLSQYNKMKLGATEKNIILPKEALFLKEEKKTQKRRDENLPSSFIHF